MSRLLLLVRKDLLRRRRSPLGVLLILAFPLVFSLLIALTFGTAETAVPRVRLVVENHDQGLAGRLLASSFGSSEAARYFAVEEVASGGAQRIERGEATACLRIPERFTDDLLAGRPARLELIRNPAEGVLPEVAEQATALLAEGLSIAARTLHEPLLKARGLLGGPGGGNTAALSDAELSRLVIEGRRALERARFLLPPAITLTTATVAGSGRASAGGSAPSLFASTLPGIAVFALFMIGDLAMRDLLAEEAAGTLRRQLCGPLGAGTLVAAKALYAALLSALSLAVLLAVVLCVRREGLDGLALAVVVPALVLAVTGFSAAVYGMARSERQAATFAGLAFLVMAFTGGAFMPVESLSPALRRIAPLSPMYWGSRGLRAAVLGGGRWPEIAAAAAVLAAVGAPLLLLGGILLRRRIGRGAAG